MSSDRSPKVEAPGLAPFYEYMSFEILSRENGTATLRVPHRRELSNTWGELHGGTIAALIDATLSQTVRSANPDLRGLTTIMISISFLEPGSGSLLCHGKLVRAGKTIANAEATVEDESGTPVARGTASFRMYRHRPT